VTEDEIVRRFIAAHERLDLDAALELMSPDAVFDNVPYGVVHGHDNVRAVLEPFYAGCERGEWVIHRQISAPGVVMNERTDRFFFPGGVVEFPLAGVFEIRDGLITLWRDYFDLGMSERSMAQAGISGVPLPEEP
jgi:limonene-1,2-epoxide hydrolase